MTAAETTQAIERLTVHCPECGTRLRARTDLAGRRLACPKCGTPVEVQPPEEPAHAVAPPPFPPLPAGRDPVPALTSPLLKARPERTSPLGPPPLARAEAESWPPAPPSAEGSWMPDRPLPPPLPVPEFGAARPELDERIDGLSSISMQWNRPSRQGKLPHFLLRDRGPLLESIVSQFVGAIRRERRSQVSLGWAAEQSNDPGVNRPVRVLNKLQEGHVAATDVVFRAEGRDLYVRFDSLPRTWITWLRWVLSTATLFVGVSLLLAGYLYITGAFKGWALDYAQKHGREQHADIDKSGFLYRKIAEGYSVLNASQFSEELRRRNAGPLLDGLVREINEGMQHLSDGNRKDAPQWVQEMGQSGNEMDRVRQMMVYTGLAMIVGSMKEESLARLAVDSLDAVRNPDCYFYWEDRHNPRTSMFVVMYPVTSIEFATDVNLREFMQLGEPGSELEAVINEAYESSLTRHSPWGLAQLFWADPKLGAFHVGIPASLIAGAVFAALYFLPHGWLRFPCRWLGWPTPDEFENMVAGHNAWTERVLSDTLLHGFGVQEGDKFAIHS